MSWPSCVSFGGARMPHGIHMPVIHNGMVRPQFIRLTGRLRDRCLTFARSQLPATRSALSVRVAEEMKSSNYADRGRAHLSSFDIATREHDVGVNALPEVDTTSRALALVWSLGSS